MHIGCGGKGRREENPRKAQIIFEDNIKTDLEETGQSSMDWIDLVYTVMNFWVP